MNNKFNPEMMAKRATEENQDLISRFKKHLAKTNAEHAFVSYVLYLLSKWWGEVDKTGWNEPQPSLTEFAAFYLFPHFGNTQDRDPAAIQALIDLLGPMQQNRTFEVMFAGERNERPEIAEIETHLRLYREGVRGSAYSDQTKNEIENIQGPFEVWFRRQIGLGPLRALQLIDAIHEQLKRNRDGTRAMMIQAFGVEEQSLAGLIGRVSKTTKTGKNQKELVFASLFSMALPDKLPVAYQELNWMPQPPTAAEWQGIITLIGLTPAKCSKLAEPSDVKSWPLFVLPDERVLFIDFSCIFDEVFAAFDRLARSDQRFYDRIYRKNQTNWLEARIGEFLRRLFPTEAVFAGLTYPDPDNPGGETELDAAVNWGPFLVLVEAKGCQFRLDVAHSDFGRLRTDLEKNVSEAFEQAQRAAKFIASDSPAVFREKPSGRELRICRDEIRRVFKVSVTLHHLADLTTQLANLRCLNLFTSGDYPLSISLGDLEVVTRFCEGPDVFLHYIQRRLELQRSGKNIHGDELDIFGIYLDTRLHPSQFWKRKPRDGKDFTMLMLTGRSERFDRWKNAQIGIGETPIIGLDLPGGIKALLSELRRRNEDSARWIAFSLLNLSQAGVQRFERLLQQVHEEQLGIGQMRSATFVDGDLVAIFTAGNGVSIETLRKTLFARAALEKYRRRVEAALGFSILLDKRSQPFDSALWLEGKWQHEPEMEKVLHESPPLRLMPGQKPPGRNDPCLCGSGKKFKKCCLPFFASKQLP